MTTETKELTPSEQALIEVEEEAAEAFPNAGGIVEANAKSLENILFLADNIEKMVAAHNKIKLAILKLAQPGDWTIFGRDKTAKAEIGFAGANRIGNTLGVSYSNWSREKFSGRDDLGEWYRWEFEADCTFRNRTVRVYGRAGSRDKFFGKDHGRLKLIHETDEGNIKIAAMRACKKEGVKEQFALHRLDPKYLLANGVVCNDGGGYDFKDKESKATETAEHKTVKFHLQKIGTKSGVTNNKPWTLYNCYDVDGTFYSTFDKGIADTIKAKGEAKQEIEIKFVEGERGNSIVSVAE